MKILKENINISGLKKETVFYNYKEELQEMFKNRNIKIGKNRINGIELHLSDNCGEISLTITNFDFIHLNIPYQFSIKFKEENHTEKYMIMVNNKIEELYSKIGKVKTIINEIRNGKEVE